MANPDIPEVMNVRSKLSFSKNQIESPSKFKTSPEPPPKSKLDQNFSSGKKKNKIKDVLKQVLNQEDRYPRN